MAGFQVPEVKHTAAAQDVVEERQAAGVGGVLSASGGGGGSPLKHQMLRRLLAVPHPPSLQFYLSFNSFSSFGTSALYSERIPETASCTPTLYLSLYNLCFAICYDSFLRRTGWL